MKKLQIKMIPIGLEWSESRIYIGGATGPSYLYKDLIYQFERNGKLIKRRIHPLEIEHMFIDVSSRQYFIDGSIIINTKRDGIIIWRDHEFVYDPPF